MCKLCLNGLPPYEPQYYKSIQSKLFTEAVKHYTSEFPCLEMQNIFRNSNVRSIRKGSGPLNIDNYILLRLVRTYGYTSLPNNTQKHRAEILYSVIFNNTLREKPKYVFTSIEKYIAKGINTKGTVTYKVDYTIKKLKTIKRFKTLEEAQNYKQRILNDN